MATKEHSKRYETVRNHFLDGWWSEERVRRAVKCGWITEVEMEEILDLKEGTEHDA